MKLEFLGHDERYIVEQSLMTLFPLEKPTYDAVQPGDEAWCRLAAAETAADCQVTAKLRYHGYTAAGTFASPLTGTDFEKEGQRRYAVGPASIWHFWICIPSCRKRSAPRKS